jgi:porin
MTTLGKRVARALLVVMPFGAAFADGEAEDDQDERRPSQGGPDRVENQLETDAEPKPTVFRTDGLQRALSPYFDFKQHLQEEYGLSAGVDYTALFLGASESLGKDEAASGMLRFFGAWELTGRGTDDPGKFVYKVEHRHGYTSVAPSGFGLHSGYVGVMGGPFSDQDLRWTNLYWHQRFAGGDGNLLIGFLDVTDFLDAYGLASPWLHFLNLAFSTGSSSIPLPNDAGLGATVGGFVNDRVYVHGGVIDSNADPTEVLDGFESLFDDHELFSHVEIGWTPSYDRRYFDNAHVTLWHVDKREKAATSQGWGINGSFTRFIDDTWMPFLRGGWAEDGGSLLSKSISTGVGYYVRERADLLGVGLNWGEPNRDTFGPGLSDQYTAEVFYRVQLSPNFAVTPDFQLIKDPALNPSESSMWVLGLRARLSL